MPVSNARRRELRAKTATARNARRREQYAANAPEVKKKQRARYSNNYEVTARRNKLRRAQYAVEIRANASVMMKKVRAKLLRAAARTVNACTKDGTPTVLTPTYYFEQSAALVANPDFLTSLPGDEVNPLKESFDDVKCEQFAAVGHSTIIPMKDYESVDGVRMSQPYSLVSQDMKDRINHNHWRDGELKEPTSVYGNASINTCTCFTAGHWKPAHHEHYDESPTVTKEDGTEWKEFTIELLLWFPWMLDFFCFHQVIMECNTNISQLVKCSAPTGAGAVLRVTYLLPMT